MPFRLGANRISRLVVGAVNPPFSQDLVRWYDAENPGSSPSSTWEDLSGTQNGTVNTNVSYVSATPAYYDFAGTTGADPDNTITYGANPFTGTTPHTIIGWCNPDVVSNMVWQFTGENDNAKKIVFSFLNANAMRLEWQGGGDTLSGLSYSTGTWAQYAYSFNGTTVSDITCYINTTSSSLTNTTTLNLGSTALQSGDQPNNPNQVYNGKLGVFLAYNRAFSSSEIEEVYEYYRTRYGV